MQKIIPEDAACFVVMDLEWNQRASRPNRAMPHEIIEIGAVKLDRDLRLLDEQQYIIKPKIYPVLDKHIREVTGIEPEELENGVSFPRAFSAFLKWCGPGARLCTWGPDDYPVLLRNARFYERELPLEPPLNLQLVYAHLLTDKPGVQVGLSTAMEALGMEMDLPAHRALNDALYTARLMARLRAALEEAPEEKLAALRSAVADEALAARSATRAVQTHFTHYDDALADKSLTSVPCPVCGGETKLTVPWFDAGHGRYMALCDCPEHGTAYAQMHFKRLYNDKLAMNQRVYLATPERAADVLARRAAAAEAQARGPRRPRRPRKEGNA